MSDEYLHQRLLAHADLHAGDAVRLFVQLGDHRAFAKTVRAAVDENRLDLHQAFVEIRPAAGTSLRLGRQELSLNPAQRFVALRDSANVRANYEGGRIAHEADGLRLDAFLVRPMRIRPGSFDDERDEDQSFAGIHATRRIGEGMTIDAYWLRLDREGLAGLPAGGRDRRDNIGLRFAGSRANFDWDAETLYQFGRSGNADVSAWAASADLGYTIPGSPLRPRLGIRVDAGSGDGDPTDDEVEALFPLFAAGAYFNEASLTSWTNLVALRPSLRLSPSRRLTLLATTQLKWRENVVDAVYLGASAPLAATRLNRAREIGQVYSIEGTFQLNRNLAFRAYYLHHSAGDAIRAAGGEPVNFAMASAALRF